MKKFPLIPFALFLLAAAISLNTLFGPKSLSSLTEARAKVQAQHRRSYRMQQRVDNLRNEVEGLESDPRVLEKAVRNNLLVAGEDETIVLFND